MVETVSLPNSLQITCVLSTLVFVLTGIPGIVFFPDDIKIPITLKNTKLVILSVYPDKVSM